MTDRETTTPDRTAASGWMLPPLVYTPGERAWRGRLNDGSELLVQGNSREPAPWRLDLAREVVAQLASVTTAATAYLDAFVDRERIGSGGWTLTGIDVGRPHGRRVDTFEVAFAAGDDTYGSWTVGFGHADGRQPFPYVPCWFGRRQI